MIIHSIINLLSIFFFYLEVKESYFNIYKNGSAVAQW